MTSLIALAAAAAISTPVLAAEPLKAEVIHWWTSGGEAAAVKVFADAYNKAGGQWVDSAIAGGDAARAAGINRIVGGNPPTMMQFNTGKQLDELVKNDFLANLDAAASAGNWKAVLPKAILNASMRNGHFYALPVNIHGQNWVFFNQKAFAEAGITAPKTWEDVLADGPKLKAKGIIPLAHGGQKWQDKILFDAVLAGDGGAALFRKVYSPDAQAAIADPKFKQVAETFKKLRGLMDEGMPGRNWNDATAMVITGKAGMQVMGDWAKGEFLAAHQTAGKEYGCAVIGSGYIMGGDVFVFPKLKSAEGTAAQALLEKVMFSPETQIAFNMKKGSVPVRTDVEATGMDSCAQQGMTALKDPERQLPSVSYLISPDEDGALQDVVTQYLNTPAETSSEFVSKFAAAVKASG
ncbi:MAG: ABC transporter substrate-binding protein [Hyphomicrobiales bacterium]|nr:ABC transporter substrate-binding protein [Hyphomicrobiales bacterium]MDE2114663.1 carbohydrate ABC transporter substrate-binding protein [Hyphomicrobiales bacterium]